MKKEKKILWSMLRGLFYNEVQDLQMPPKRTFHFSHWKFSVSPPNHVSQCCFPALLSFILDFLPCLFLMVCYPKCHFNDLLTKNRNFATKWSVSMFHKVRNLSQAVPKIIMLYGRMISETALKQNMNKH